MHIRALEQEPLVQAYLQGLQEDERSRQLAFVSATDVFLTDDGRLSIRGQLCDVSEDAEKDLANEAGVPLTYFNECDNFLKAVNFNRRLPVRFRPDDKLAIVSNGNAVIQLRRAGLERLPASQIIETLLEAAPAVSARNTIRAVQYHRSNNLDVALVSSALETEPVRGDTVCGGIHVGIEESGAVQVGAVSYRLICSNGAMARVCAGGQHRLRRGNGRDSTRKFIGSLREFARAAWQDWTRVANGLRDLTGQRLQLDHVSQLVQRLRQSPFFISARTAQLVLARLTGQDEVTMYDLHNAITAVGSHEHEVLPRYRYRLRLGAGLLARGRVGVCAECRQLILN